MAIKTADKFEQELLQECSNGEIPSDINFYYNLKLDKCLINFLQWHSPIDKTNAKKLASQYFKRISVATNSALPSWVEKTVSGNSLGVRSSFLPNYGYTPYGRGNGFNWGQSSVFANTNPSNGGTGGSNSGGNSSSSGSSSSAANSLEMADMGVSTGVGSGSDAAGGVYESVKKPKKFKNSFEKELFSCYENKTIPTDVVFYYNFDLDKCFVNMGDWHINEEFDACEKLAENYFSDVDIESEAGTPSWATEKDKVSGYDFGFPTQNLSNEEREEYQKNKASKILKENGGTTSKIKFTGPDGKVYGGKLLLIENKGTKSNPNFYIEWESNSNKKYSVQEKEHKIKNIEILREGNGAEGDEIIDGYTQKQAIEDGLLIEVSKNYPEEAKFYKYPVLFLKSLWDVVVKVAGSKTNMSDMNGILRDILYLTSKHPVQKPNAVTHITIVKIGKKNYKIKAVVTGDDMGEPVVLVGELNDSMFDQ